MGVANRIKETRKELKMSQHKLAKTIKFLNQSQISKIENGDRKVTIEELVMISQALRVPVSKFID